MAAQMKCNAKGSVYSDRRTENYYLNLQFPSAPQKVLMSSSLFFQPHFQQNWAGWFAFQREKP